MEAIILAGGFGKRLQEVVKEVPKPMALINNKPFLEYQLNYLKKFDINRIIFSVGYRHEFISNYFGNSFNGVEIEYAVEEEPLGTGGGIKLAMQKVQGEIAIVVNGDTMFNIDLTSFLYFHIERKADLTIGLRHLENIDRYGAVEIDNYKRITAFKEKNSKSGEGYINGGTYLISKGFFEEIGMLDKFSIEKDCFEKFYQTKKMYGYPSTDYFLDIGIPEDFYKAQYEFKRFEY